jgi:hypothetical protein
MSFAIRPRQILRAGIRKGDFHRMAPDDNETGWLVSTAIESETQNVSIKFRRAQDIIHEERRRHTEVLLLSRLFHFRHAQHSMAPVQFNRNFSTNRIVA